MERLIQFQKNTVVNIFFKKAFACRRKPCNEKLQKAEYKLYSNAVSIYIYMFRFWLDKQITLQIMSDVSV